MKQFISNRHGLKISVLVEIPEQSKGLAFVMHGHTGYKEQFQIEVAAKAFLQSGYVAVRFDTTHSRGESDGSTEYGTPTTYYEDLEDVINWASGQEWYQEPFILFGTSLGGLCTGKFSEEYPEKVKGLVVLCSLISGPEHAEYKIKNNPERLQEWEKTGWLIKESHSKPGEVSKIPWLFWTDLLTYDLNRKREKLTMPVLLITSEKDTQLSVESIRSFYEKLTTKKELREIPGAGHTLYDREHLKALEDILKNWLKWI